MADALDRLAEVGHDLLQRVDGTLTDRGAPPGDPVWPLLRQVGALPGDVLRFGLRLDERALRAAAGEVRAVADRFAHEHRLLTGDVDAGAWEGTGAEAFTTVWRSLTGHLGTTDDPATMCGRLMATGSYVDALADWVAVLRHELAEAIARVATSAEAVTLRSPLTGRSSTALVEAAARVGTRFLQPAADAFTAADDLRARWSSRLSELRYTPPAVPSGPVGGVTRVQL
ncbi:WXG100 family type VII secretion target [Dactylosporangium sucinum]|uniref:Uncharacterized protein n=1 Tax=Dactylosporangium sucinum TaxID=1424081 RepID=A0A917TS97_9ACTN|nr:hypothetical protein [Dactylosporangium sucinum]GGM34063.1 hypothetical protein GCM10007977_039460 [Dactylosporangium sucinum]